MQSHSTDKQRTPTYVDRRWKWFTNLHNRISRPIWTRWGWFREQR